MMGAKQEREKRLARRLGFWLEYRENPDEPNIWYPYLKSKRPWRLRGDGMPVYGRLLDQDATDCEVALWRLCLRQAKRIEELEAKGQYEKKHADDWWAKAESQAGTILDTGCG